MALPQLAAIMTPALLSTLRNHPILPQHSWYIIAASALTILNRPDEIAKVYAFAVEHGSHGAEVKPNDADKLDISRRIREALIKTSAVGGLPKVGCLHEFYSYLAFCISMYIFYITDHDHTSLTHVHIDYQRLAVTKAGYA